MKENEFECSVCHNIYEKEWTEEEAREEQKDNGFEHLDCDIVCDDCYKKLGIS